MSRLVVSNQLPEEIVDGPLAVSDDYRSYLGTQSHRMVWCARPGDIVVLPTSPDPAYLAYVGSHLGMSPADLRVVVPPTGAQGDDLLYDDRLAHPAFVEDLRSAIRAAGVDEIYPFYYDRAALTLAEELGLHSVDDGLGFFVQGGVDLVNSKATFRALAAGNRVNLPPGAVVNDPEAAEAAIWELLSHKETVIVKQDIHGGGIGNEVITREPDVNAFGADSVVVVEDRAALAAHLTTSWQRYSANGRRAVVIEQYIHDCTPVYAEFVIGEGDRRLLGHGEMRMKPIINGLVVPGPTAELASYGAFLDSCARLAAAVQAMGYRGNISFDAMATPEGQILFNECNGRVGGSTHIHRIGTDVVGADYATTKVLVERRRCSWPSFTEALEALREAGIAYDRKTATGVLITVDDAWPGGPSGQCLIVGPTRRDALATEELLVQALDAIAR
ncbi:preATP grasp domain-containing protein [Couchioplanes azureus]|uniref:preATP grasp domain-containing protein n=1 Tax=Couchioplanes caeruleus TaxID=56438 RepID=UPI001670D289|nr:peptide ligase PGM1-related protein [Couchioplanes caeruleus]GGQ43783.1 hypothetical protein GCM10010166_10320 [Couchioplanes caeruleus subsp. azureus]